MEDPINDAPDIERISSVMWKDLTWPERYDALGVTQAAFAEYVGISAPTVCRFLLGTGVRPESEVAIERAIERWERHGVPAWARSTMQRRKPHQNREAARLHNENVALRKEVQSVTRARHARQTTMEEAILGVRAELEEARRELADARHELDAQYASVPVAVTVTPDLSGILAGAQELVTLNAAKKLRSAHLKDFVAKLTEMVPEPQ